MLADELLDNGVDVIASGDHIWKRKEIVDRLSQDARILRPANYPRESPGFGATVVESKSGVSVGVINLQGRVFMQAIECPFRTARAEIDKIKNKTFEGKQVDWGTFVAKANKKQILAGYFCMPSQFTG